MVSGLNMATTTAGELVAGPIGKSSDGSSYQLMGLVNYRFENSVRIFAGYRYYHMEYDGVHGSAPYELDLDYSGPMVEVSYRFQFYE